MCVSPTLLSDGKLVACRNCWQCRQNRIEDWVGRCIAEKRTSAAAHSVTLTYGRDEDGNPDHLRAAVLTYSDVQRWLKVLRRHGYPCRYFAVGEYGSLKRRSHWHLVLFWREGFPKVQERERIVQGYWKHGTSFWEAIEGDGRRAIRYVTKYITKDIRGVEAQVSGPHMSKKPPLGYEYFRQRALRHVEAGLSPQGPEYRFSLDDVGRREYRLTGRSLDLFCGAFVEEWAARRPGRWWPPSELIDDYCERMLVNWVPSSAHEGSEQWLRAVQSEAGLPKRLQLAREYRSHSMTRESSSRASMP